MAGHSKWANIKHKKAKVDAQKGKIYTKIAREIIVATRMGGGDPNGNFRLKMAIEKAKDNNIPNENIQRAIQKGLGSSEGSNYEEMVYEGYAPGGVAVMMDIMTDNRNRTAGEIRHIFSKNGGNLGETGCVAWMFDRKGVITIDKANTDKDEDEIMMIGLDAGAEDLKDEDDVFQLITVPEDLEQVKAGLENQGVVPSRVEVALIPKNTVEITDEATAQQILKLMDLLEEHDDVQEVYANFDIADEIMEKLG